MLNPQGCYFNPIFLGSNHIKSPCFLVKDPPFLLKKVRPATRVRLCNGSGARNALGARPHKTPTTEAGQIGYVKLGQDNIIEQLYTQIITA